MGGDTHVYLGDLGGDGVPADHDALPQALLVAEGLVSVLVTGPGPVTGGLGGKDALQAGTIDVTAHGEAGVVGASGHHQLVTWQADEDAVELVTDLLADEGVGMMARNGVLVAHTRLGVGYYRLELDHGFHLVSATGSVLAALAIVGNALPI